MSKNRRGLGRGLGALIQSTVPEEDTSVSDPTTGASATDPSEVENAVSRETQTGRQESRKNLVREHDKAVFDETAVTEGPKAIDGPDADADRLTTRYLAHSSENSEHAPARETRRPVDVFFPDRRNGDVSERRSDADAERKSRNGKQRPTMPPVSTSTLQASEGEPATNSAPHAKQRESIDISESPVGGSTDVEADTVTEEVDPRGAAPIGGKAELRVLRVRDIHPNPRQPREVFGEEDMEELVASILQVGVLQPIVVRPVEGATPYELVMGERRWRASQRAGLDSIPAIVRHTDDTDLLRDALLENLHRSQLNPLEEAAAYEQLLEDFDCTHDELSARIGRSRPQISNTLRLLKLPPMVQRRVASGVLSAGHARALLSLVDPADMEKIAQRVVSEGLSVRATEEMVSLNDGVRQSRPKPRAARSERHERLDHLANTLTDQLDTTVKITLGARKGKIAIDFASVEDLNRIMALIHPSADDAAQK